MSWLKSISSPKEWPLYKDMTAKTWRVAIVSCLGAIMYGYDITWWSSVLGMPEFTKTYGVYNAATESWAISAPLQSAGSGIPIVGQVIGAFLTPYVSDRFGRRGAMILMSCIFIVAVIIEVTATSFWQIIVGRLVNAVPIGIAATLIPVYQSEYAPATCRGSLISIYTWFIDAGAVTATGVIYHTYAKTDTGAWKIVMGLQMIFAILILATLPMIPESPRWLCMKGRRDEALAVLQSLRTTEETAELELLDIEAALEVHNNDSSWADLFRGANLRRTIISVAIPVIEAWQGLSFIGNYLVVFFISLGSTNVYELVLLINSCLLITITFFFWAPDYFGRRGMLMFGSLVMFISIFTTAGVAGHDASNVGKTRQTVAVAMLFIWAIVYSSTWANLTWVTIAEISTTKLKAKTNGMAYFAQSASSLVITFVSPYMQDSGYGNMGPYIGFFFGSFSFIGFLFVYFCFPETKGASIEDLDMFFEQKLSIKDFGNAPRGAHEIQGIVVDLELGGEAAKQMREKTSEVQS